MTTPSHNGTRIRLQVRDLRAGDYLLGSRRTVAYVIPYGGVRTPAGKAIVKLAGEDYERTWGRYTSMVVIRP